MTFEAASKTLDELHLIKKRCEDAQRTKDALYLSVVAEIDRRQAATLDTLTTVTFLHGYAKRYSFLSYGAIAKHYDLEWDVARMSIFQHLDKVCRHAHSQKMPLISAIVVNQESLTTGDLDGRSLKGFMKTAYQLGFTTDDLKLSLEDRQRCFLRDQQKKTFEWGQGELPK